MPNHFQDGLITPTQLVLIPSLWNLFAEFCCYWHWGMLGHYMVTRWKYMPSFISKELSILHFKALFAFCHVQFSRYKGRKYVTPQGHICSLLCTVYLSWRPYWQESLGC